VQVLDLAGQGMTNKQIAKHLYLSQHTVARHLSNCRDKLGATNRAEAAVRLGSLSSPAAALAVANGRASQPQGTPPVSNPYRRLQTP
jgi:orotate phosphoribosyltransferase-like protein